MIEYRSSRTRSEWHEVAVPARYPGAREALRGNVRGMATAPVTLERVTRMTVASVYPLYLAKLERKGRTKPELDEVITWLTGFDEATIAQLVRDEVTFAEFFDRATLNANASLITGVICGVRVEEIEEPLMQRVRYLDKLVDELAKGKAMEKVLRH